MFVNIQPSNGIPIYEQIVRQVKFAVADGTLSSGQLLPSVRELAKQLAINPNTIQRAYQQLQDAQIVESLRGRGIVVCRNASKRCLNERQRLVTERLQGVVSEALHSGLSADTLRELFEAAIETHTSAAEV